MTLSTYDVMLRTRLLPVLLGGTLLGASLFLSGCGGEAQSKEPETPTATATPVAAATVETGTAAAHFSGTASLQAENEATVVARVGGVAERVLVEEGQFVESGAPLVQLDDDRLRLEVQRAEVTLAKLKRVYERMQTMRDKQLVSAEEYEQARSDFEAQQVAYDLATLELEYTTVRAPISGMVSKRHVKTGNMVRANDATFEITDFDPLWAVMHVPERELDKLRVGQPATLRLDALPDATFDGRVKLISPTVDPETGTFRVVVEVRDPSRTAKPGMFGRVRVQYDTRDGALLVPKSAVIEEDDVSSVFVIRDTIARRTTVTTGYSDENRVEILNGLTAEDTVVVSGNSALRDSAYVEIVTQQ